MQAVMKKNQYDLNTTVPIGQAEIHVFLEGGLSDQKKWVFTNSFSIGRHESADVFIKNTSVSRFHAVVYHSKGEWWVLDMSSMNGTIVDGQQIARHRLGSQSHLRLGRKGPTLNLYTENNIYVPKLKASLENTRQISRTRLCVFLTEKNSKRKEWAFTRPFIIGRHIGADIRIYDTSVSRFHSKVNIRDGKWWIKDMNSANGTIVNGQKISEQLLGSQAQLKLGRFGPILNLKIENTSPSDNVLDKVGFRQEGDHQYTIINETNYNDEKHAALPIRKGILCHINEPIDKRDNYLFIIAQLYKKRLKKYRKYLVCLASVLLIGLGLAGYGYLLERPRSLVEGDEKVATIVPNDNEDGSISLHDTANSKMKMTDEENVHEGPQQTTSTVESTNKDMATERNAIALNHTSRIYFNAANKFSKNRYWKVALEYYQNVSMINPDYSGVQTEIERMKFESGNQAVYEEGVTHINAGRYEEGIDCLKNIPENSVYFDEVNEKIAHAAKDQAQQDLAKAQADENKKAETRIAKALQYYAQGKIKPSVLNLNRVLQAFNGNKSGLKYRDRARALKKHIEYSASLYRKGNKEYASGQHATAINTWKRLLEIDQKLIHRKNSYFAKIVSQKMADEFNSKALRAQSNGDLPSAYTYTKIALNLKADHTKSLEIRNMLSEKSKQLFQEGYILEEYNPEKAMEKWKLILKICPPESEYYKKALRQIGAK